MEQLEGIIFDADGVIFDSEKLWDIGDSQFLAKRGLHHFPEGLKERLAGTSVLDGTALLLESAESNENVEVAAKERISIMEKLYAAEIEYMPGFEKFHSFLKSEKIRTAVATSMNRNLFPLINSRLGFIERFEGKVYSVNDVPNPKPAPDVYLHAARMIGIVPSRCLVIEDAPNGIRAAKAAGMFCIGLASTFSEENLPQADVVYRNFDEIKTFIISCLNHQKS